MSTQLVVNLMDLAINVMVRSHRIGPGAGAGTGECIHISGPLCSCCINKMSTKTNLVGAGFE